MDIRDIFQRELRRLQPTQNLGLQKRRQGEKETVYYYYLLATLRFKNITTSLIIALFGCYLLLFHPFQTLNTELSIFPVLFLKNYTLHFQISNNHTYLIVSRYSHLSNKRGVTLIDFEKKFHPPRTFPPSTFINFLELFHPPLLVYCIYVISSL